MPYEVRKLDYVVYLLYACFHCLAMANIYLGVPCLQDWNSFFMWKLKSDWKVTVTQKWVSLFWKYLSCRILVLAWLLNLVKHISNCCLCSYSTYSGLSSLVMYIMDVHVFFLLLQIPMLLLAGWYPNISIWIQFDIKKIFAKAITHFLCNLSFLVAKPSGIWIQ